MTVTLLTVAGFLLVLTLLAWQVRSSPAAAPLRHVAVVRRIYETRVIETVVGGRGGAGSVTQSVSGSAAPSVSSSAPATRSS